MQSLTALIVIIPSIEWAEQLKQQTRQLRCSGELRKLTINLQAVRVQLVYKTPGDRESGREREVDKKRGKKRKEEGRGWGQFVQGENRLKVQLGESSLLFGGVRR